MASTMIYLGHDEQIFSTPQTIATIVRDVARLHRLNSVVCRLERLERLAGDADYTERLAVAGRSLRLSAAIAWASEIVERTRIDCAFDGVDVCGADTLH